MLGVEEAIRALLAPDLWERHTLLGGDPLFVVDLRGAAAPVAHADAISGALNELLTPYRRDLPPGAADPFRRALPSA